LLAPFFFGVVKVAAKKSGIDQGGLEFDQIGTGFIDKDLAC
jgi:hypothetical protein